jgi:hypothetical protein
MVAVIVTPPTGVPSGPVTVPEIDPPDRPRETVPTSIGASPAGTWIWRDCVANPSLVKVRT